MSKPKEKELVANVYTIDYAILKGIPPGLNIRVTGDVISGGWSEPELHRRSGQLADGILELEFIAVPPSGPATDVISTIRAEATVEDMKGIRGVRISSKNNTLTSIFSSGWGQFRTIEQRGLHDPPP